MLYCITLTSGEIIGIRESILVNMSKLFQCPAYHKAGYENIIKSIKWQSFFTSKGEHHWLGDGVYFWQYFEDAVWWPGDYKDPVILIADLECEENDFLDLDDIDVRNAFYAFMAAAFEEMAKRGKNIQTNAIVNGASCNYFKELFHIELIRYSFPDKSNRPQFCATEAKIAKNIRIANEDLARFIKEYPYAYI